MNNTGNTQIVLNQITEVLASISDKEYVQELEVLNVVTIGQHIRHIVDFYLCILDESDNVICYDARTRDTRIESDRAYCKSKIDQILSSVKNIDLDKNIEIHSWSTLSDSDEKEVYQSNIKRELLYAFDHAIHHLALVKIGLKTNFPHIYVDNNLGVAPSTIKFQQEQCVR